MIVNNQVKQIIDPFNRVIDYLRVSVTDRCNYRCNYCMPKQGYHPEGNHKEYLDFDEIATIVQAFATMGLKRVRLTGGEPLVRKGLPQLVEKLSVIDGIKDIALSTNAHRLERFANDLKKAGLHRVNVSLDSLNVGKFHEITRGGDLPKVLKGIAAAQHAGLTPIKVNCVVMKGVNDDEIENMAQWALQEDIELRFIEMMPIGSAGISLMDMHYDSKLILERLESHFGMPLYNTVSAQGAGPARYYGIGNGGKIGVISAVSQHFCKSCNRVRLTAKGILALCLGQEDSVNLRTILRTGIDQHELQSVILEAISRKPERHFFKENVHNIEFRQMVALGG